MDKQNSFLISEILTRGVVNPTKPLHDEYLRLAFAMAGIICASMTALAALLSLMVYAAINALHLLALLVGGLLALGFICAIMVISIGRRALDALDWYQDQSEKNQDTNRQVALTRAEVEVNIYGGKNKVVVGDQQTTNNVLTVSDSRDQTIGEFMRHYAEFLRRAKLNREIGEGKTGFERRLYLANEGASRDYQFDDGAGITRAEYERLIENAKLRGDAPEDRRKGSAGRSPALSDGKLTHIE